ncbi:hypothetical protein GBA52_027208, partial [Prunus armeniaca]
MGETENGKTLATDVEEPQNGKHVATDAVEPSERQRKLCRSGERGGAPGGPGTSPSLSAQAASPVRARLPRRPSLCSN